MILNEVDSYKIVVFYAISTVTINFREHNHSFSKKFPNSTPVLKICMIGVDKRYQSHELGKKLIETIFTKAAESAKNTNSLQTIK